LVARFKHAFKDLINVDLNKFEDKMKSIEELKKKTKEVSGVAFQEKTFKQSDGEFSSMIDSETTIDGEKSSKPSSYK
jgi:hypothetical protein